MSEPESTPNPSLAPAILGYYNQGREANRVTQGFTLELVRTQELLQRFLPPAPAVILDVGGGAGVYGLWLAQLGYEVHLIDPVPLHVEQALEASALQPDYPLKSALVGDARKLEWPAASVDAVLLLGPLYHLVEREDRLRALREAYHVTRPKGVLCSSAISRYASFYDGLQRGYIDHPTFMSIIGEDLCSGQHRNAAQEPRYFTTAFFHHPDELRQEIAEAGWTGEAVVSIEGPGWFLANPEAYWSDPDKRNALLALLRMVEIEPSILGASSHLMGVGHKSPKV